VMQAAFHPCWNSRVTCDGFGHGRFLLVLSGAATESDPANPARFALGRSDFAVGHADAAALPFIADRSSVARRLGRILGDQHLPQPLLCLLFGRKALASARAMAGLGMTMTCSFRRP
jgi:hypothetical protein